MFWFCSRHVFVALVLLCLAFGVSSVVGQPHDGVDTDSPTASPSPSSSLSPSTALSRRTNLPAIIVGPVIGFILMACGLSLVTCCSRSKKRTAIITPASSIPVSPAPGLPAGFTASKDATSVMFNVSVSTATVVPFNSKSYPKVPSRASNGVPKTESALSMDAKFSDNAVPPVTIQVFKGKRVAAS
jgi:hypothetical protein